MKGNRIQWAIQNLAGDRLIAGSRFGSTLGGSYGGAPKIIEARYQGSDGRFRPTSAVFGAHNSGKNRRFPSG